MSLPDTPSPPVTTAKAPESRTQPLPAMIPIPVHGPVRQSQHQSHPPLSQSLHQPHPPSLQQTLPQPLQQTLPQPLQQPLSHTHSQHAVPLPHIPVQPLQQPQHGVSLQQSTQLPASSLPGMPVLPHFASQPFAAQNYASAYPSFLPGPYSSQVVPVSYAYMGVPMGSPMPQYPMLPVEQGMSYGYRGYAGNSDGQTQSKHRRFRRRYYQIYRKYKCSFAGCTKSYGSLNHLNTHIVTKKHGLRKSKQDFKDADDGESHKKLKTDPEHTRETPLSPAGAHSSRDETHPPKSETHSPRQMSHSPQEQSRVVKSETHSPQQQQALSTESRHPSHDVTELETSTSEQSPPIMSPVQQQPLSWKSSPEISKPQTKGNYKCTMPTQEVGLRISRSLPHSLAAPHEPIRLPSIPSIITRCDSTA